VQPLLQWESNVYYVTCGCICSLKYLACKAHAPYYSLWPAPLYSIFPHYFIKGTFSGKSLLYINCVFRFSLQLLFETFFILRRNERDMIENVYWSSCNVTFILLRFQLNLNFCRQIFEKYSNIKFHENPSSGNRVVPCGWTDGRTDRREEANSRF
jgi:hypothetical protein